MKNPAVLECSCPVCVMEQYEQSLNAPEPVTLDRVRDTLAAFYRAPLSMSSVQPILTLAEELNPSLVQR